MSNKNNIIYILYCIDYAKKKKDDSSGYAYGFCEMKLFILALTSHNHRWR